MTADRDEAAHFAAALIMTIRDTDLAAADGWEPVMRVVSDRARDLRDEDQADFFSLTTILAAFLASRFMT